MKKIIFGTLFMLGIVGLFGVAGGFDTDTMSLIRGWIQGVISLCMILIGYWGGDSFC